MKRFMLITLLSLVPLLGMGQTTLVAGDIIIVAINGDTDATYGRGFSFMPLVNLEAGTEIFFTDYGWSDVNGCFINSTAVSDVFIKYTAPSGGVTAGTVLRSSTVSTTNFGFYYAYGVSTYDYLNLVGVAASDEVLAFQGSIANPIFIYAATYAPAAWATSVTTNGVSSGTGSALPGTGNVSVTDLVDDVTALSFNQAATTNDNSSYTGPTSAATKAEWQARVSNYSNWTFNDAVPIPTPPIGPFVVVGSVALPAVTTADATSIASNSATLGGEVTADGGATVTERGVVLALSSANTNPQIGGTGVAKVQIGGGIGSFGQSIGSLSPESSYHFNAYAINSAGTNYGSVHSFTTLVANTSVVLYDFFLRETNGEIFACWQTASEENSVGFDLLRWNGAAWAKVNEGLVFARNPMGADYCVADPGANGKDSFLYKLVEHETDGTLREYGPFERAVWSPRLENVGMDARGVTLRWLSREGESYDVLRSPSLMAPPETIADGLTATPPVNEFTDEERRNASAFYQIRVAD